METSFAQAEMLIRKPQDEVFRAFIDPAITTRFWFTKSSGKLEAGKTVTWTWEMYDVSVEVEVERIEPNKKILMTWGNGDEKSAVEWSFSALPEGTFVSVVNSGLGGDSKQQLDQVRDSTGGFTLVLAGAKAYLEFGIELGLIRDRFPKGK